MQEELSSSSLSENEYYVEKVLDKKIENGEVRYLIKWEGWPAENSTWEPISNLDNIQHLIDKFEAEKRDGRKKLGRPPKADKDKLTPPSLNKKRRIEDIATDNKNQKEDECHEAEEKTTQVDVMTSLGTEIPEVVKSVKRDQSGQILCYVKFQERSDGLTSEDAYVPSWILKDLFPKILINYYESKIKFVDKK